MEDETKDVVPAGEQPPQGPDCMLPPQIGNPRLWMEAYIERHMKWSLSVFGHGYRTEPLLNHIAKEIEEVKRDPHNLEEWIDFIILALDGAWRCGLNRDYSPTEIIDMLDRKQRKNLDRVWVIPIEPAHPCEHQREERDGVD